MSQEFPQKPSELRDPSAESREAFLNRPSLKKLNLTLGMIFQYIDEYKIKEQLEEGEIADMKRSIEYAIKNPQPGIASPRPGALREFRQQTLVSLYAPSTLSNILTQQAEAEHRPLTPNEGSALADYTQFYDIFTNHPELRVRLLEKMISRKIMETTSENDCDAFGRFLYEFYGTEEKNEEMPEYFLSLDGQADLLEAWNTVGDWELTKEEFAQMRLKIVAMRNQAKQYFDEPLVAGVITPRLRDKTFEWEDSESEVYPGMRRTLNALVSVAHSVRNALIGYTPNQEIGLVEGKTFLPGLEGGFVDLGPLFRSLKEGRPRKAFSDFRGFAAFAMSPKWTEAIKDQYGLNVLLRGFNLVHHGRAGDVGGMAIGVGFDRHHGEDRFDVTRQDNETGAWECEYMYLDVVAEDLD